MFPQVVGHIKGSKRPHSHSKLHEINCVKSPPPRSGCIVQFSERGGEAFLAVGVAKDLQLAPRACTSASIDIYRFVADGTRLELLHKVRTPSARARTRQH